MAIVRWNPYTDLEILRNQFDRMFQDLTDGKNPVANNWQPPLELEDGGDKLILKVQLPGWEAKDLDISVTRDTVSLKGQYTKEHKLDHIYYTEFYRSNFQRAIKLPVPVRNNEVQAQFKDGLLILNLPKVEEVINRVVKVNLGETNPTNQELEKAN